MSKSSAASSRSRSGTGTFPSPITPNYHRHRLPGGAAYESGWCSERVPLPTSSNARIGGSGLVLPFNNGRKLPSKWEDAEKWILSPIYHDNSGRSTAPAPHHRRPKSKSGPLGHPPGIPGEYSSGSPLVACFDAMVVAEKFTAASPFSEAFMKPAEQSVGGFRSGRCSGARRHDIEDIERRSFSTEKETCMKRSSSLHGWSDTVTDSSSSLPTSQDTIQGAFAEKSGDGHSSIYQGHGDPDEFRQRQRAIVSQGGIIGRGK